MADEFEESEKNSMAMTDAFDLKEVRIRALSSRKTK